MDHRHLIIMEALARTGSRAYIYEAVHSVNLRFGYNSVFFAEGPEINLR